jgi:hypothetical protein
MAPETIPASCSGFFAPGNPTLQPNESAVLCRQWLAELANIGLGEQAAIWAQRVIGAKNSLTAADAANVEEAFHARLVTLVSHDVEAAERAPAEPALAPVPPRARPAARRHRLTAKTIDKSLLALRRRVRDRDHVRYVAKQPCLLCGRRPSDAHHPRCAQHPALGRKVSDEFTVPLCRGHHREVTAAVTTAPARCWPSAGRNQTSDASETRFPFVAPRLAGCTGRGMPSISRIMWPVYSVRNKPRF